MRNDELGKIGERTVYIHLVWIWLRISLLYIEDGGRHSKACHSSNENEEAHDDRSFLLQVEVMNIGDLIVCRYPRPSDNTTYLNSQALKQTATSDKPQLKESQSIRKKAKAKDSNSHYTSNWVIIRSS